MKLNAKNYIEKILVLLKVRQTVGGVEVSDTALRLACFDNNIWRFGDVRLLPGVIEGGRIKDYDGFTSALKELKSKIFGIHGAKKLMNVIISLSSINIYSQVFSLPIIEGENLNKAIELNIQMVSPVDASQSYSGWQMVGRDKDALRLEILSAFIERGVIDEVSRAFEDAGFFVVAVEPRALALTRLVREEADGVDPNKAYIFINLDNSGVDFLIIRRGQLYFEYFNLWRDLADEKGQISTAAFEAAVTRSLHQIMNFYSQHWSEPLDGVILSATALKDETERIIANNFSFVVKELKLRSLNAMIPDSFVALGCGLRGIKSRRQDKEMSLLGIGVQEEFHREQLASFAEFWRLLLPAALTFLLVSFLLVDLFLVQMRKSLESQLSFNAAIQQSSESGSFVARAIDFNRSVALISATQRQISYKSPLLEKINNLAASSGVSISHLVLPANVSQPISLDGRAATEESILAFKNSLAADSAFTGVNLPLSAIKTGGSGLIFSISFNLK